MKKGDRIRKLREDKGLTQEELAKLLNTKRQTISKYEKSVVTNIPSDRIEAMADILETTPQYILGWEESEEEAQNIKKSDAIADITKNLFDKPDFFNVVNFLSHLDERQFNRAKVSLSALFEETFNEEEN